MCTTIAADSIEARGGADHFEGGVMTFDCRLHAGVIRHSNALALMRAVGLEV